MKRRGFTLIELMVVIAIIIILAAIAIPNYLTMTARARKSRVASDFASIATALETYRTDWGFYPPQTTQGSIVATAGLAFTELTGTGVENVAGKTDINGESGGIVYMTTNILTSMVNPYSAADAYVYISGPNAATPAVDNQHWLLVAPTTAGDTTFGAATTNPDALWRSDETTALTDSTTTAAALPAD